MKATQIAFDATALPGGITVCQEKNKIRYAGVRA